jgi:hypothetical protein
MRCKKVRYIETFGIKKFDLEKIMLFYLLRVHFTFKIPSFHMDFLTNHMSRYIYRVVY